MTSEAPERLYFYDEWLEKNAKGRLLCGNNEYIRADHALALVAEAYEAAKKSAFRACRSEKAGYRDENERIAQRIENELRLEVSKAIRALTPADALAAREARDRKVREEALREAAAIIGAYDENRTCSECCDVTAINEAVTALIEGDTDE